MRKMYSKKQIEEIALKSTLEGIKNEDVIVKTIKQTQPNWELDVKSILNPDFFKDTSKLYAKLALLGNELSLVISGIYTAKANNDTFKTIISSQSINIPNVIASKIFRADGTNLTENPTTSSDGSIICDFNYVRRAPQIGVGTASLTSNYSKTISLHAYNFPATKEDEVRYLDIRVQLLII